MPEPVIAQKAPIPVAVVAGRQYWWCACGRSRNQPFCDGSHKGTGFEPVAFMATESRKLFFCACKHTGSRPLCDGTHARL